MAHKGGGGEGGRAPRTSSSRQGADGPGPADHVPLQGPDQTQLSFLHDGGPTPLPVPECLLCRSMGVSQGMGGGKKFAVEYLFPLEMACMHRKIRSELF